VLRERLQWPNKRGCRDQTRSTIKPLWPGLSWSPATRRCGDSKPLIVALSHKSAGPSQVATARVYESTWAPRARSRFTSTIMIGRRAAVCPKKGTGSPELHFWKLTSGPGLGYGVVWVRVTCCDGTGCPIHIRVRVGPNETKQLQHWTSSWVGLKALVSQRLLSATGMTVTACSSASLGPTPGGDSWLRPGWAGAAEHTPWSGP